LKLRVLDVELALTGCKTRYPFRYGMVTLRQAPQLTARVTIEAEGRRVEGQPTEGWSADLLVPKWFEKDPRKSLEQDFSALARSARAAAAFWRDDRGPATVFDHWWRVYQERVLAVPFEASDRLVRGFGVALMERAVMDAACRAAEVPFDDALRSDLFGFQPGRVHPELADWDLAAGLPARPLTSVQVRHTVGLMDPLLTEQIPEELALDDGLPVALADDIRRYGLRMFKVKVEGSDRSARTRLLSVAAVVRAEAGDEACFTLDGNEQVEDLDEFVTQLDSLRSEPDGAWLLERLLWIEQPLPRALSFDPVHTAALPALAQVAPVIIDEADAGPEAFPRAVGLGYQGVSIKNCKGVFRSLLNRGLTERLEGELFLAAEDLTNLPVVALQQDLATVASLGLTHVERNGHHYFRGLGHLPVVEREQALELHPRLYRAQGDDIFLDVRDGALDLNGVVDAVGYGHRVTPDMAGRTPLEAWEAQVSP
jgi:hypothetical protein